MSFHGALLGVGFALFLMARRHELPFLAVSDRGMLPRLGCFWGVCQISSMVSFTVVTNLPWAMIFPHSDGQPRHPSQLYEAGLKGFYWDFSCICSGGGAGWRTRAANRGVLMRLRLARFFVEFVRNPMPILASLAASLVWGNFSHSHDYCRALFATPKLASRLPPWKTIEIRTQHCLIK